MLLPDLFKQILIDYIPDECIHYMQTVDKNDKDSVSRALSIFSFLDEALTSRPIVLIHLFSMITNIKEITFDNGHELFDYVYVGPEEYQFGLHGNILTNFTFSLNDSIKGTLNNNGY